MSRGYRIALVGCLALAGLFDVAVATGPVLVASFVVAALGVLALLRPGDGWSTPVAAGASLLLTAGSVAAGVDTFGVAETGTLLLVVLVAVRRADRWRRWGLAVLVAVAVPLLPLRVSSSGDSLTLGAGLAVVVAVAVAVGSALRGADAARRAAVTAVRRSEREEVARELHDVVAHHVTGMVVATQAARVVTARTGAGAGPGDASGLDPTLASIEAAGAEALAAMRRLVHVLRSEAGDPEEQHLPVTPGAPGGRRSPVPRVEELVHLVRRFQAATDAGSVQLAGAPEDLADLPGEVQAAVYRVTQEALTNTARHAPGAERVVVEVARHSGEVSVRITDSGVPGARSSRVPAPAGGGFGLIGMRERVDTLGGSLVVGPHDGGFCVLAAFPDPAAAPPAPPIRHEGGRNPRARRREGPR